MEENKTGVWVRCMNGKEVKYNHNQISSFNVGDIVEIDNDDVYVRFKIEVVELKGVSKIFATYTIKPQLRIDRTTPFYSVTKFRDAEPIEMDVYANNEALIIVPFWYGKEQYRNQSIRSTEAVIAITRKESLRTTNEDLEIKTITIPADKIKTDVLSVSFPEPILFASSSNQPEPITAMSEAEKNWWKECFGGSEVDRGSRSQIPVTELGQTLKQIVDRMGKMGNITISDLGENHIKIKENEMYTENLKEMIKKPIYVDKEITVKEPMLDNNGKQIEKDGKPVFKVKHYHGMVKILWKDGAETVAYVEGNDVYDKENGFKTGVLKYLFGNAGAHDAVDFWTNKYVKYPSSYIEVTENLCKLEEILEKDKYRKDDQKGLPHAKFLRRTTVDCIAEFSSDTVHYTPSDSKLANEFKKLVKKYFPELKGKEIYINDNKNGEVFVAIK